MAKRQQASFKREARAECERIIQSATEAGRVRLNVFVQDQDWIAIEGDRESLAFLAGLLSNIAKADGPEFVVLDSPETAVFQKDSLGIIIYRKKDAKPKRRQTKGDA
jgi:hypothetical protein